MSEYLTREMRGYLDRAIRESVKHDWLIPPEPWGSSGWRETSDDIIHTTSTTIDRLGKLYDARIERQLISPSKIIVHCRKIRKDFIEQVDRLNYILEREGYKMRVQWVS